MHKKFAVIRGSRAVRRAFTLIELLVVAGIIIILLSLVIVAVDAATRSAQKANTSTLLTSVSQSLIVFREDIGYFPPVLDAGRNLYAPHPSPTMSTYADIIQPWYSATTLTDYLIGYGDGTEDGYGYPPEEVPPLGIRQPGADGVWNANLNPLTTPGVIDPTLAGLLINRNPPIEGKKFGPYFQLKDPDLLAATDPAGTLDANGNHVVINRGDPLPDGVDAFEDLPKIIVDYWGTPIRYYRRLYPEGALTQAFRAFDRDGDPATDDPVPSISDVFLLRPFKVIGETATDGIPDKSEIGEGPEPGDKTTTYQLIAAEIALFSSGPDRKQNPDLRVDNAEDSGNTLGTEYANEDNIVVIGP